MEKEEIKYNYKQAFCLMKYKAVTGPNTYLIWNSRDGITPYNCLIDRVECAHINFSEDECVPEHTLKVGDLFFRDITPEEVAVKTARKLKTFNINPGDPGNEEVVRGIRNSFKDTPVVDIYK